MTNLVSPYARAIQSTGYGYPVAVQQPMLASQRPSMWEAYRQAILPAASEPVSTVQSAVAGLRGNLEGAAIGALLGAIHGKFGTLDVAGKYPVDGILAVLLFALSVKETGKPDGFSSDLRNMSQSCTTIACFRKTADWARPEGQATSAGNDSAPSMSGHKPVSGEDPLVTIGKKLGFAA